MRMTIRSNMPGPSAHSCGSDRMPFVLSLSKHERKALERVALRQACPEASRLLRHAQDERLDRRAQDERLNDRRAQGERDWGFHGGSLPYHFKRLIWSTLVAILPRKTTMMMASPTAASPAAMAITNRDMIWPARESRWWENGTRMRLAPVSMISTHIRTMIKFRRTRTPTSPVTN